MDVSTVRPKVAQLAFQLLGRPVHPELFQSYKSVRVERDNYRVDIQITVDGHVITWQSEHGSLTEIASSKHQELPSGHRLVSTPVTPAASDRVECGPGVHYKYECALERVSADMFWMIQKQLKETDDASDDLIYVFDSSGRVAIGGMSLIHFDTRQSSFHIQAIHTFPDDMALLKTETTFSLE